MTTQSTPTIRTGMARVTDFPLSELLALRESGDSVLDHLLRRVVATAGLDREDRVAAFNASPPIPGFTGSDGADEQNHVVAFNACPPISK